MENIVKTFFLIRSLDDYQRVRKTETEYYETHAPLLVKNPQPRRSWWFRPWRDPNFAPSMRSSVYLTEPHRTGV